MTTLACYNFNNALEGAMVYDDRLAAISPDIHLKMNDSAPTTVVADAGGLYNGVLVGGKNTQDISVAGKINTALNFDGSVDYVEVPDPNSHSPYTVTCWVKPTDTANRNIICRTNSGGPDGAYSHALRVLGGVFRHYTYDGSIRDLVGTTPVVAGTWYHVAIVAISNGYMRLYVNGVEEGTAIAINSLWSGGDRWRIAQNTNAGGSGNPGLFNGPIDDVRFYRRVLSAAQIQQIYAGDVGTETSAVFIDSAHIGSVIGSVPLVTGPISGKARVFSGSGANRIEIPHHADFKIDTTLSIEAWATLGSVSGYQAIFNKGDYNLSNTMDLMVYNNTNAYFYVSSSLNNYIIAYASYPFIAGGLYYFAATWRRSTKSLVFYINGVPILAGSESGTYAGGDNTYPIQFGTRETTLNYPFTGKVHALRWSDNFKTPKEIHDCYNGISVQERI